MDERSNRKNKAPFSNSSGVVWSRPDSISCVSFIREGL